MPTKKLNRADRRTLETLGKRIESIILKEKGYKSLDAFSLAFHEEIAKPTLYELCDGRRDMKLSTLLGLSRALDLTVADLLKGL